ncbi:hypothetical protein RND81_10G116000 [Saponaria officinalis]|uniref:Uncharacterized protein n=1 Tax=Saponaria officinalis TaxID=3572 RepID=A0AAW1I0R8_SAPOF
MLKVIKSSWYMMFIIKSLLACLGAPSTSNVEPKAVKTTTKELSATGFTTSGQAEMVAASKHFSAAHKVQFC